jgi:hypothetical protein
VDADRDAESWNVQERYVYVKIAVVELHRVDVAAGKDSVNRNANVARVRDARCLGETWRRCKQAYGCEHEARGTQ